MGGRDRVSVSGRSQPRAGWAASLPMVYAAWALVVVLLYPVCRWYARYKREHDYRWLSYL